jgi:hypothetical protein
MVCDILFIRLERVAAHQNNLYAIGQSHGLYVFDPNNIPLAPAAAVTFNATGLLRISPDGNTALAGQNSTVAIGTASPSFDRVCQINLTTPAAPTVFYNCAGIDSQNDIAFFGNSVFITAEAASTKVLDQFTFGTGALNFTLLLPELTSVRLAVLQQPSYLLITMMDLDKVIRVDLSKIPLAIDATFRIPTQLYPIDITLNTVRGEIYILNLLSSTVSVATTATLFTSPFPAYTAEPPVTLSTYRTQIIQAFFDLLGKFTQFLKDAFCDQFLINCPSCTAADKIYLGCVEIQGSKVYKICNFDKRRYVKSAKNWEYWLSTFPVLPVFKKLFAEFCCKVL